MKTIPLTLLAVAAFTIPAETSRAQPAATGSESPLVNVATASFGAKGVGAGESLVAGSGATLAPGAGTPQAFTVINLAGEVEVNRVALQVGQQKGKVRIVALKDDGTPDLASGRVITELQLDGSRPTVSADVGDVKVKRVAIVWVPDTPGQPLTLSNVGVFTSKPEPILQIPEVKALQQTAASAAPAAPAVSAAAAPATETTPSATASAGSSSTTSAASSSTSTTPSSATTSSSTSATTSTSTSGGTPTSTPSATAATTTAQAATPASPASPATPASTASTATPATPARPATSTPALAPAAPVAPPAAPTTTAISVPPQTRNVSR